VLQLVIAVAIVRDPRPRTLFLGLAASTLVVFCFLTAMHERYAYAALPFLLLLLPEPRVRWLAVALAVVFTLNLFAALPPTDAIGALVPIDGLVGVLGSIAMLTITALTLVAMRDRRRPDQSVETDGAVDVALTRRVDDAQAINGASIIGTVVRL
jgi:hypothetical protein